MKGLFQIGTASFLYCLFLSVSRYIRKIADIIPVALIYFENRRYNSSCADIISLIAKSGTVCKMMSIIIRKISQIIRGQCLLMDEMIDL